MKILNLRPAPTGEGNVIATLDAEVAPGIRLFGVRLLRMPDGGYRVFGMSAAFDRDVVAGIAEAALSYGGDRLEQHNR